MAELIQIHKPANSIGKPRIVFIHGLDGDIRSTWMYDSKNDATLWPHWLGMDTLCPVWLLGYGAATSRWRADAMALPRLATSVLESLAIEPELMNGPLVLIGHSLGGLVIKKALEQGAGRDVDRHRQLVKNIKGIVFVGTPHFGSLLASIASSLCIFRTNPQVSDLALNDASLEMLNQVFVKLQMEMEIKVRVYSETQPLRLPGIFRRLPFGVAVVSPSSAQPHIPGEAGTPIEADHLSIAKPISRTSGLYPSVKAFIEEVNAGVTQQAPINSMGSLPLSSESFDALAVEERSSEIVHLSFATHGYVASGNSEVPVCGALCLTSDDPDRLRQKLAKLREKIANDPLVPTSIKVRLAEASLLEIVQTPIARIVALRELSTTSFSAYFYYCTKSDFDVMPENKRSMSLLVQPLFDRLCKRNQQIKLVNSQLPEVLDLLATARQRVISTYWREPAMPIAGSVKFVPLEELASFVVLAACNYLSTERDAASVEIFESLRTRIRYAENIATGEKHLRDKNPLP